MCRSDADGVAPTVDYEADIAIGKDWLMYKNAAERIVARIADNDCLTCQHWQADAVYAIAVELATSARTLAATTAAPVEQSEGLISREQAIKIINDARGEIYDLRELVTQIRALPSTPAGAAISEDDKAKEWAWQQCRKDVGATNWTVGEYGNYYGFFTWGWWYRARLEKQRLEPLQSATATDPSTQAKAAAEEIRARGLLFSNEAMQELGGEPFDPSEQLNHVAEIIQRHCFTEKTP